MMKETSFSDSVAKNRNSLLVKKSPHDYESNVGDKLLNGPRNLVVLSIGVNDLDLY